MKNEKEIEKIYNQEQKVSNLRTYVRISFFLVSAVVIIIFVSVIINHAGGKLPAVKILVTLIVYAVSLVIGYLYDWILSKKLDRLWNQKKSLL